jgi:hypothetical protein
LKMLTVLKLLKWFSNQNQEVIIYAWDTFQRKTKLSSYFSKTEIITTHISITMSFVSHTKPVS